MNINQFETHIGDTPCICEVVTYHSPVKPKLSGPWEEADPGVDAEFEFEILTLAGKPDKQLEAQITEKDVERLEEEWQTTLLEHKHYFLEHDD